MKNISFETESKVGFKINVPQFLKEVFDNNPALGGVVKVPANILREHLLLIAARASELNDPVLNGIMCSMALYAVADPYDKENYDPKITKKCFNHPDYKNWQPSI